MIDHKNMKLGKKAPRRSHRTLRLANYIQPSLPPPPTTCTTYEETVKSWPMMMNDNIGDCTCAAAGHLIQLWTTALNNIDPQKSISIPTDNDILTAYEAVSGYNPNTGANDNGAVLEDVLPYWQTTGFAGHKIGAYASLEPNNSQHIMDSVFLFGGVYIGVNLPISAQTQTVWQVPAQGATGSGSPGSWGGHCVPVVGYDTRGLICVTWGALKYMTWNFWNYYCDEAYAVLSPDWIDGTRTPVTGFDSTQLQQDLAALTPASTHRISS